jgi:hypothetical protein
MPSDQEWSQIILLSSNLMSWFCSRTESSSILENTIYFQISVKYFTSCYLPMAVSIARFIGMRHANIHWKSDEDVYAFSWKNLMKMSTRSVFNVSGVFVLKFGQRFEILSFLQTCPAQNSSSICQLRENISPEFLIVWRCMNTRGKEEEVLYIFAIRLLVRI